MYPGARSSADGPHIISWWHPASKNLLRLEAGYPALRCRCHIYILKQSTINRSHAHNTHDKNKDKDDTGNTKTPKHSHTHKTHSRNDERQQVSSCCQSRRRRPQAQDRRRWFDARRAAEGGDVVGLTVRSMVTVATRRPRRQPAMRPTQAHLLTLSLVPTRGTGHPPRENDLYRSS